MSKSAKASAMGLSCVGAERRENCNKRPPCRSKQVWHMQNLQQRTQSSVKEMQEQLEGVEQMKNQPLGHMQETRKRNTTRTWDKLLESQVLEVSEASGVSILTGQTKCAEAWRIHLSGSYGTPRWNEATQNTGNKTSWWRVALFTG